MDVRYLSICAPVKAGCTYVWSAMVIPAGYWARLWIAFKILPWSNEHFGWRIRCAVTLLTGWCFTPTGGRNLPASSSGKCAATWTSLNPWGVPECASITRWPNRSGQTLKTEFYDRKRWATRAAARQAVAYWIEVVYNRRRRHSALGMVSPVDFETHITQTRNEEKIAA